MEVLPEPVETEGWTNADLMEKWRDHPGIYLNLSSDIPNMLGIGTSATGALFKRFNIVGPGVRRPINYILGTKGSTCCSSTVEMLAEPVGTEGWTNDDLLVK